MATDAPFTAAQIARYLNDSYADVWEISGGRIKRVPSATAWTSAQLCTGIVQGILTDEDEILHLWATTTAPAALACVTNSTTLVTSAALFGALVAGMAVSGTGIPAGTTVAVVTDTSNLQLSVATTASGTPTLTFSPTTGPYELDRKESAYIKWLKTTTGMGTYLVPKCYALERLSTVTPGSVNYLVLEYWPPVTGFYMPVEYVPQFTPIDAATVTTPDVNDLESRDIALLAASRGAQAIGRAELVPGIIADISDRTRKALERKLSAMLDAKQDA